MSIDHTRAQHEIWKKSISRIYDEKGHSFISDEDMLIDKFVNYKHPLDQ